jgi:hypothetical protein
MSRMVKEYIKIDDCASIDALIEKLAALRAQLPGDVEAEVAGCDIVYVRPQSEEEAQRDARFAAAYREARERVLSATGRGFGGPWAALRAAEHQPGA